LRDHPTRLLLCVQICLASVLFFAAPAAAQTGTPPDTASRFRPEVTFSQAAATQNKKPKKKDPTFRWIPHPTLQVGIVEVALRARLQFDARASDIDVELGDDADRALDIARRRLGFEGQIGHYAYFQVEREIGDDEDPWRDVFLNYQQFEQAQFQYGKFKVPFSLDENTSPTNLDFVYRSLAANTLAPGRDIGWMVHGRVVKRIFRYEFGMFDHDGRNARPRRAERVFGGETTAGRVSVQPFRTSKTVAEDLLIGVAWTSSDVPEGRSGLRGETVFGPRFFTSDYIMQGQRKRLGFEMRWRPGPFSIKSEYIKVTDERLGESVEDTDLSPLRAVGWYVSGTWAITGEKKADGLDVPKRPLLQGGYGAVEVAARVEKITFDSVATGEVPSTSPRADVILGNSDRVMTLGVNWYANRWIKVQFNLIQETMADPAQGPAPDRPRIWSRILRFQFQL
jgi:phosphate-selective porin OprO and OprP